MCLSLNPEILLQLWNRTVVVVPHILLRTMSDIAVVNEETSEDERQVEEVEYFVYGRL